MPITDLVSRRTVLKTIGVAAAGLAGVVGANATPLQQQQRGPTEFSTLATFDPPQLPENIAVASDGTHYLSMAASGEIWQVAPDGDASPSSVASLPFPEGSTLLGIATSSDDSAVYACHNTGDPDTNGVWHVPVGDGGDPSRIAAIDPEGTTLNGITRDALDGDALLVTDHTMGAIWRVPTQGDGEPEPWLDSPLLEPNPYEPVSVGVDGIAVGPDGDVWVDNLSFGSLVRIPVAGDGSAGEPSAFAYSDELFGADGMTVGSDGTIYVAVNQQNRIVRVDQEANVETIVGGEILDSPADVHFGAGESERTLYLCNAAFASVGVEGEEANPSYMSVDLGAAGTPAGTATAAPDDTPAGTAEGTAGGTPAETVDDAPAGTETDAPAGTETDAPAGTETDAPADSPTGTPE